MLSKSKSFLFIAIAVFFGVFNPTKLSSQDYQSDFILAKISFDISQISPEGLIGQPDALRAVSYEFCIPANPIALATIQAIDTQIKYYFPSPGRIGCQKAQYLCIGHTHNPKWPEILFSIARLEYVERIIQFDGE
jgi:hypothetical protein